MVAFTDFVPDKDTQGNAGTSLIYNVGLLVMINLYGVCKDIIMTLKLRFVKWIRIKFQPAKAPIPQEDIESDMKNKLNHGIRAFYL